jgi:hypothetical protein
MNIIGNPTLIEGKNRVSIFYYLPVLDENNKNPLPVDAYLLVTIDTLVTNLNLTQLVYNDHSTSRIISSFVHRQ